MLEYQRLLQGPCKFRKSESPREQVFFNWHIDTEKPEALDSRGYVMIG